MDLRESFARILERKRREYGEKFDPSDLASQFPRYYESDERIAVRFWHQGKPIPEIWTGTVGITGGWRPSFLLMLRNDSSGSPHLLDASTEIVAVLIGKYYRKPDGQILHLRRSPETSFGAWREKA